MFKCNVVTDGWGCCSRSYVRTRAQPWHYVEAFHTNPKHCCEHNDTMLEDGTTVTYFTRSLPSERPVGNRRCPLGTPKMCDEICSGPGDFCCRGQCGKLRTCSPILYPEPRLMRGSNDTQLAPNMKMVGRGCCSYEQMVSQPVFSTSKNACLYYCDINEKCVATSLSRMSTGTYCRQHLEAGMRINRLAGFQLLCQKGIGLEIPDYECWTKQRIER